MGHHPGMVGLHQTEWWVFMNGMYNKDYKGIKQALSNNPNLANEGIPYDDVNTTKAHPLHRICDGVFSKKYTDEEAVKMAKIFLEYGANVNGNKLAEKHDTPLIAAVSLYADQVAIFYIENGANILSSDRHIEAGIQLMKYADDKKLKSKHIKIRKM